MPAASYQERNIGMFFKKGGHRFKAGFGPVQIVEPELQKSLTRCDFFICLLKQFFDCR